MEWLTDKIEEEAMRYIEKIDEIGGVIKAIEDGYIQREIQRSAYEKQKAIDEGELVVVGVNKYRIDEEIREDILRIDQEIVNKQIERTRKFRENRDGRRVESAIEKLKKAAENPDENLMPYILDAVKAKATLGEMTDALREIFGEYRAPQIF